MAQKLYSTTRILIAMCAAWAALLLYCAEGNLGTRSGARINAAYWRALDARCQRNHNCSNINSLH